MKPFALAALLIFPLHVSASVITMNFSTPDGQPHNLSGTLLLDTDQLIYDVRAKTELRTTPLPIDPEFPERMNRWFEDGFENSGRITLIDAGFKLDGQALTVDPIMSFFFSEGGSLLSPIDDDKWSIPLEFGAFINFGNGFNLGKFSMGVITEFVQSEADPYIVRLTKNPLDIIFPFIEESIWESDFGEPDSTYSLVRASVPEPSALIMMVFGLLGIAARKLTLAVGSGLKQ